MLRYAFFIPSLLIDILEFTLVEFITELVFAKQDT